MGKNKFEISFPTYMSLIGLTYGVILILVFNIFDFKINSYKKDLEKLKSYGVELKENELPPGYYIQFNSKTQEYRWCQHIEGGKDYCSLFENTTEINAIHSAVSFYKSEMLDKYRSEGWKNK